MVTTVVVIGLRSIHIDRSQRSCKIIFLILIVDALSGEWGITCTCSVVTYRMAHPVAHMDDCNICLSRLYSVRI